jgi:hypothetical protein
MTNIQALARLHAIESFRRVPLTSDGKPYGPGFFRKRDWVGTLNGENRRVSLRLCRMPCIRCKNPIGADSTGDHIIPLSDGGPAGAQNYLPLCRSHNASKGRKDLFEWWIESGNNACDLDNDVICAYCRLKFSWLRERGKELDTAPDYLHTAITQLCDSLPPGHALAINEVGGNVSVLFDDSLPE